MLLRGLEVTNNTCEKEMSPLLGLGLLYIILFKLLPLNNIVSVIS